MKTHHFQLTAVSLAILCAYGTPSFAEDDEVAQYTQPDSSISVGVGYWSQDRLHKGMFDGMRDSGAYGSLDADIKKRDNATGTWTTFEARNLGQDNAELKGAYEKQGEWGIGLGYSQIPRTNPNIVNTGLLGIGTQRQTIVAPAVVGGGADYLFKVRRDKTTFSAFRNFSDSWKFQLTFKNEEKEGNRQMGGLLYRTLGSSASAGGNRFIGFFVEPIDTTTQQLDATVSYAGEKLRMTAGYYGSWFRNHNERVDVIGTGNAVNEVSLQPDNQAHQVYAEGNYQFAPTTRGLFKVSHTRATQDDPFMPTMFNNVAAWAPVATLGSRLNGVVNTTDLMAGVTAQPMKSLSLVAKLNYWDRNDKTPVRVTSSTGEHNNPFRNTKTSLLLDGTYRLQNGYSINAGLDHVRQKRGWSDQIVPTAEFFSQYRRKVNETTLRATVRRHLTDSMSGSLGYSKSLRTGSDYLLAEAGFNDLTPIHVATRKRDKWKAAVDWNPTEALGLQFSFADARDRYPAEATQLGGIRNGVAQMWTVDAAYTLSDDWKLNAWYSYDTNTIKQSGLRSLVRWEGDISDKADTFGLGLKGKASSKIDLGVDLNWTRVHTSYSQETSVALAGGTSLPSVTNRLTRINVYGDYAVDRHSSVRVSLIHEAWHSNDWAWNFSGGDPFSYTPDNTSIRTPGNESSSFVGARYTYKFQ